MNKAPQLSTKHGILYWLNGQGSPALSTTTGAQGIEGIEGIPFDLAALYDLANEKKLTHLWIHPSYGLEILEPAQPAADFDAFHTWKYDQAVAKTVEKNPLISFFGRRKFRPYDSLMPQRRAYNIHIIMLEHVLWGWPDELTPYQILSLIDDLEAKLGTSLSGSPSGTGLRYLKKTIEKHLEWLEKPDASILALPWDKAAKPLIWQRVLTVEELERKYIIAIDKNGAYPRAAQEELFGTGWPLHVTGDNCVRMLHEKMLPGMWNVKEITPPYNTEFNLELLPHPLWNDWDWVASPMIKLLLKMGYRVSCDEGYVFTQTAPIFKKYVENLWKIRQEYGDGTVERTSIKLITNDLFGMLRSAKISDSIISRPDWYAIVVAGSRANMFYNIIKYALQGLYPFMIQMDALYFVSDSPDPMAIGNITANSQSLGGYKHKWTLPLDDEVKAILRTSAAQSRKLQLLNALAEKLEVSHAI